MPINNSYVKSITEKIQSLSLDDLDTSAMVPYLFSNTYAKIKKDMTEPADDAEKDKLIKDCIKSLLSFYETAEKKNIKITTSKGEEYKAIFINFGDKMKELHTSPDEMTAEGMYRLLRHSYIKYNDEKKYNEEKESIENKFKANLAEDAYYPYNPLSSTGSAISDCIDELKNCHRALRGSSDEFKEIERELNDLNDFIGFGSIDSLGVNGVYVTKMLRVLEEKANQYVEARLPREMKHSENGYKGKRIAAMRRVAQTLKANAEALEKALPGLYKQQNGYDFDKDYGELANRVNALLVEKAGKITFSKTLYSEIKSYEGKYDASSYMNNDTVVAAMDKALRNKVIPLEKCDSIYDNCGRINAGYVEKLENVDSKDLRKQERLLDKLYKKHFGAEKNLSALDNMIFEETVPDFFTDDADLNATLVAERQELLKVQLKTRSLEPVQPDIYQLNSSKKTIVEKPAQKNDIDLGQLNGPLFQ